MMLMSMLKEYYGIRMQITAWDANYSIGMQITTLECILRHGNANYGMGMQNYGMGMQIAAWECKLRHWNADYNMGMQITTLECRLRHWNANYGMGMQITAWECKLRHWNADYDIGMQITALECKLRHWNAKLRHGNAKLRHWNADYNMGMQITTLECKITAWECKITAWECRLQHGNADYNMGMQITAWECRLRHGNADYNMGMQITAWECKLRHGNAITQEVSKSERENSTVRNYSELVLQDKKLKTTKANHPRSVASYDTRPQNKVGGLIAWLQRRPHEDLKQGQSEQQHIKATLTFIFLSRLLFSLHHARHFDVSFCSSASSTSRDERNRSMFVKS